MPNPAASAGSHSFAALGVPDDVVAVLDHAGITSPFDIQSATIPDALEGLDVLGRAPTGSGKTLAFGIPMVVRLKDAQPHHPTGLILSPTRELAEQIRRELAPLAKVRGRTVHAVYGGVGFGPQTEALRNGVDMLVACPGRLLDLMDQGEVHLDQVQIAVIDEADRMADMGFLPVVKQILDETNSDRQTVMFSATLGKEVKVLTNRYQDRPVTHEVGDATPDMENMSHRFIRIHRSDKAAVAAHEIRQNGRTIVFCRTRHGADRVARQLKDYGVKTGVIHGRRTQGQRDNALKSFVNERTQALIATDVAARGIHVDGIDCVVHFDPPEDDKAYTHRSGRTARAGATGVVVSLITEEQLKDTKRLQRQIGVRCEFEEPTPADERDHGKPIITPGQRKDDDGDDREDGGQRRGKGGGGKGGGGKGRGGSKGKGGPKGKGGVKKSTGRTRKSPGGGDTKKAARQRRNPR